VKPKDIFFIIYVDITGFFGLLNFCWGLSFYTNVI